MPISREPAPRPAVPEALPAEAFVDWLRSEGSRRYHALHPFNSRMHEGRLSRSELQAWVINRYYYQTRIPIKDAILVSKSESPAFRRMWLRRITDHDGSRDGEGGLQQWLRLAEAVGVSQNRLLSFEAVLPGVRFACDAYVTLVRERSLLEGVAASLTEFFAPELMSQRIAAFERHYGFVNGAGLEYFKSRVPRAERDSKEALDYVVRGATTFAEQSACVAALVCKTEILWHLLDCVAGAPVVESVAHAHAT
jgi:pyrroloquinoline-quinone synthase